MNGHRNSTEKKNVKPSSKIMTITPAMAQEFLLKNNNNRPLKKERVDEYVSQMRKGFWAVQNDDICFDWDGNLLNGQHRLNAVVIYGKPVEMGVKFGLHPNAFAIIDSGKIRTSGEALSCDGMSNSNAKASIVRFYMQYNRGKFAIYSDGRNRIGNNEILNFARENKKKLEEVYAFTKKVFKSFKPVPMRYLGALYWKLSDIDQPSADAFFDKYATGIGLTERHPIYILRTKLLSDYTSVKKYPIADKILWFVMAWNYYRQNRTVTKFRYDKDSEFPRPI